jgi:maleylpyruvate isomerase
MHRVNESVIGSPVLYDYWRSSAAWTVRIALSLKQLLYKRISINIKENKQYESVYRKINPQGLVPTLHCDQFDLAQARDIIEYLEERYTTHLLLPKDLEDRSFVRMLSSIIASDTHPLINKRVKDYLENRLGAREEDVNDWCCDWLDVGLRAYEKWVEKYTEGRALYSCGYFPTMADCFLIPQVYKAKKMKIDTEHHYPIVSRIYDTCMELDAFKRAAPENQPDAPKK